MMRCLVVLTACLCLLLSLTPQARSQVGFDRRGGDYTSFSIRSGDPAACAARCEREARCRAWSFVYPGSDREATCWLKGTVPARTADACCVSGVKGAGLGEPRIGATEFAIDRAGADFRVIDLAADATGATCKAACEADGRCRAWTYVRPGYIGPGARCFLKERVVPPRRKPCCISGVVR
jgi:hypothetical protein